MSNFGKYELVDRIGKGGMAEVFRAKSVGARGVEKTLVIKRILPELAGNERFIEMFIAEAKIAMGLNHPNIVQIYDFGRVDDDFYLAMEFIDGVELGRLLQASVKVETPLPIGDAVYLAMEVARGLDYAHQRKDAFGNPLHIVHRDISPQNLLVSREGSVKIVDFGIAKASSVADDGPNVVKGKYQYMSPEQAAGLNVDHRSDLFSLGVVLFEMVCGRPLFGGSTPEETVSLVTSAVVPDILSINPGVPRQLEHLIYKALSRDPEERFHSAREFQIELTRVLYSMPEIHDATTVAQHLRRVEDLLPDDTLELVLNGKDRNAETRTVNTRAARTFSSGGTPQLVTGKTPGLDEATIQGALARQRKEVVMLSGRMRGLIERRHDESWEQLFNEYQRVVDAIAYKNDAIVHSIEVDSFLILLGLPISSDNDAERGIRMALDLQEAIVGLNAVLDPPLSLRIGVSVGEVILEQGINADGRHFEWAFHGEGLEAADVLARRARQGQIVVGEHVFRRIRRNFQCRLREPTGETEGETPAYEVVGLKSPRAQIKELRRSFQSFYGREIQQRLLRDVFRQALLHERARGLLLVGPAGVGKSTLVEKFLSGLNPREVRVVRAVASPFDSDVPLASAAGFFSEMLRLDLSEPAEVVRETLRKRLQALFVEEGDEELRWLLTPLFRLFGVAEDLAGGEEFTGEERRRRLFLTLSRIVNRFARTRPLVIAIDDVHFIDPVMRAFAAQYFDRSQKAPVFFIGTAREAGSHVETRSWKALLKARNIKVESLGELSLREGEKMVRNCLAVHDADRQELVQVVLDRSGGNPLYIKEIVSALKEQGHLDSGEVSSEEVADVLPVNVEGLVAARLDRLSLEMRDALQRLSLLRSPFSVAEAGVVLRFPEEILHELVAQELLTRQSDESEGGRVYRFSNALLQEVAAKGLVPAEARLLHLRIADHLIDQGGRNDGALIARHLDLGGEGARALAMYIEAVETALERFGASECLRLCERVLAHELTTDAQRFRVLLWRERAFGELGEKQEVEETLEMLERLAQTHGDNADRAHVAYRQARFHFQSGELDRARADVARSLQIAREAKDKLAMARAWRMEAGVDLTEGHRDRALGLIDRAIATVIMAGGEDAQEEMVRAYNVRGVILRQSGRHREALEAYETALAGAEALESSALLRQLLTNSGLALAFVGEFSEARRRYMRALDACRRLGHRRDEALVLVNLGQVTQMMGLPERAIAFIRRGIYLAQRTNDATTVVDGQISLGLTYMEAGELEEARELLSEGLTGAKAIPHAYLVVCAQLALAQVCLLHDEEPQPHEAIAIAHQALQRSEQTGMRWGVATANEVIARALMQLGELEEALVHSRRAVEILDEVEIYGIDQILVTHAELLDALGGHEEEYQSVVERAFQVYKARRDGIDDEEERLSYMDRAVNRRVHALARTINLAVF